MSVNPIIERLEQDPERLKSHWCLPREEARFLSLIVRIGRYRQILEIGTSIGYSTLHLAQAAVNTGGHITTIDASAERQAEALENLRAAGLANCVTLREGDALTTLHELQESGRTFDLMFIDARKSEYLSYLELAETLLIPGGLLIADNTRSHRHKMQDFIERVHATPTWDVSDLETPSGLVLAQKRPASGWNS